MKFKAGLIALAVAATAAGSVFAQTQGVSKGEIVIGSMQDLSGPVVGYSKPVKNGMEMRVEEINAAGGIHGRKLKLIIEDHGYDPKKAVLATQKLVQKDKIFAMIATMGSPTTLASMPILLDKNILNLFPFSAARETFDPPHRLKYSVFATYFDQVRYGMKHLVKQKGYKKVCALYQDDDFGLEIMRGAEAGAKEIGLVLAEKTTYKRGATDFSSQIAKMKDSGCELVVLGTIIRETIGSVATARKLGWGADFLGTSAAYTELIHKLGGPVMNGFYATNNANIPYLDDASKNVRDWAQRYKDKYKEDPSVFSVGGYVVIDLFIRVAEKSGPNLTVDSFVSTIEKFSLPRDMFGNDETSFTKTKHLGSNRARLSQIINGKWTAITDYITD